MTGTVARWRPGEPLVPLRELVGRGGMLAIPTESSYGLAVDPRNARAVAGVFAAKGRSADQPLPIVVAGFDQIEALGARVPPELEATLTTAWPGPLTVLLPYKGVVPAAAGSARLGFRVPGHPVLLELLRAVGHGLTATSANLSGEPPVLDPDGLESLLSGADSVIVDAGVLPGGPPSTIVGWCEGALEVVRSGAFAVEQLTSFSASSVEISVEDAS